ncbi:hypothetical protein J2R78_008828 [Bradyrhizobium sp. USDA 4538]|nr:hypothetical protein [Bradyrhizobium sp. USDA 4538]MCP1906883.1 hypothetical protein [Bradyrhizobium sp. USDA 4537]MCP1985358.1 hypothetical protein [Bradyrhizobium sp. USDA 4539]
MRNTAFQADPTDVPGQQRARFHASEHAIRPAG